MSLVDENDHISVKINGTKVNGITLDNLNMKKMS